MQSRCLLDCLLHNLLLGVLLLAVAALTGCLVLLCFNLLLLLFDEVAAGLAVALFLLLVAVVDDCLLLWRVLDVLLR